MNIVYLNGAYTPLKEAKISILDRGFLFADGVYEVIAIYDGKMFRWQQHLKRLANSLKHIHIKPPLEEQEWHKILTTLLVKNDIQKGHYYFYIQVTRGAPESRGHTCAKDTKPTILVTVQASTKKLPLNELMQGKNAITAKDSRWQHCHIKSIALLPNILFSIEAKEAGSEEAILIRDGNAQEGASSNIFIVKNNTLITPPLSNYILGGITRDLILELAQKHNIPCEKRDIKETELTTADEIWITSSTREIYPIVKLNGVPVGNGKVGPIWQKMYHWYQKECYA